MFRCIEYTAFLWKAKGRHGTHSPFAYWLVDVVGRLKTQKEESFAQQIKSKKTRQFVAKLCQALTEHQLFVFELPDQNSSKPCIYIIEPDLLPSFEHVFQHQFIHPASIFILLEPHAKANQQYWQNIYANKTFHFTADCYFFGLLSPRPGQAKEHFYLKLS
jgi:hypothetical protein